MLPAMNVLIIGGGGREHALAWKLSHSPRVTKIFCAPGNAGTARLGENVPLAITDGAGLLAFAEAHDIGLTVVGPDDALAGGIVDRFQAAGRRIFGPTRAAARLEWSKIYTKDFLQRHGIPTAASGSFEDSAAALAFCEGRKYPLVIKADGLATGKGVIVAESAEKEAEAAVCEMLEGGRFGAAGPPDPGRGVSPGPGVFPPCAAGRSRRTNCCPWRRTTNASARATGARTRAAWVRPARRPSRLGEEVERRIHAEIMQPLMRGLAADGLRFQGLLFPGLMLTDGRSHRCSNSTPASAIPRRKYSCPGCGTISCPCSKRSSTVGWIKSGWNGTRARRCASSWRRAGYPGSYETGQTIQGLESITDPDVVVFHAGTKPGPGRANPDLRRPGAWA